MKPKLNKLITLLLLLATFSCFMEVEDRVSAMANKELSKWASLLPVREEPVRVDSINPYQQQVSLLQVFLPESDKKELTSNN